MNTKTYIAIILIVLGLGVVGYWAMSGAHVFTQTQVEVEKIDELFGTTTTEWEDKFQPGLEYSGPVAAVLLAAGAWLLWKGRVKA